MNRKINWMRRSRINAAVRDIPVRFGRGTVGFEVKIKSSPGKHLFALETLHVQKLFYLNVRSGSSEMIPSLPLFRNESVMAPVTLSETLLNGRRLEAILKTTRKKRC